MGKTTPQRKINPYDIKERFYTLKITAHQYFSKTQHLKNIHEIKLICPNFVFRVQPIPAHSGEASGQSRA